MTRGRVCLTAWIALACAAAGLLVAGGMAVWEHVAFGQDVVETRGRILATAENPYRCCERRDCRCVEAAPQVASCTFMQEQLLDGPCAGPSACCEVAQGTKRTCTSSSSSGSGSGSKGDTCTTAPHTKCVEYVDAQACRMDCGSCYRPSITFLYAAGWHVREAVETRHCGLRDTACVRAFLDPAVINATTTVYYSQDHPERAWFHEPAYAVPGYLLVPMLGCGVILAAAVVLLVYVYCCSDGGGRDIRFTAV